MRFLLKILPLLLIILFISVIYFGVKTMVTHIQEHPDEWAASAVTENQEDGFFNETYGQSDSYKGVNNSDIDLKTFNDNEFADNEEDIGADNFEDDMKDVKMDNPEATLDAELEGKSSNQLLASSLKKKSAEESSATNKKSTTAKKRSTEKKSTSSISMNKVVAKTNQKPSMDKLTTKGKVPTSYGFTKSGEFLVIAGSFKSKANASTFIDNLEDKGLKNLEIIELKEKNLNRVCVSRHSTYDDAKQTIKMLKRVHNVDSYVHSKQN